MTWIDVFFVTLREWVGMAVLLGIGAWLVYCCLAFVWRFFSGFVGD